jgi:hypothetical protein
MRAIRLPNGNLLIPADPDDPDAGGALVELGLDDPGYGAWLAISEPGEDPRAKGERGQPKE